MIEKLPLEHPDDELLVDYVLGHSSPQQVEHVHKRMAEDGEFARRSGNVATLLKNLDHLDAPQLEESLIARTLAAAEGARRTTALLDREASMQRTLVFPTFSLKELGAVAALLFVVGAILIPSFRHAQQLSSQQACLSQAGQIGTALLHYANDYNGYLPNLNVSNAAWLDGNKSIERYSNSRNLWVLVRGKYASYVWFQCPSRQQQSYVATAGMLDFPGQEVIGYSYQNGINARPLNIEKESDVASEMAILADRTPAFEAGQFRPDGLTGNSPNHEGRGQAVLYLDRHAEWSNCPNCGVNGDNIWMVDGVTNYSGTEAPTKDTDSFLLPNFVQAGN